MYKTSQINQSNSCMPQCEEVHSQVQMFADSQNKINNTFNLQQQDIQALVF